MATLLNCTRRTTTAIAEGKHGSTDNAGGGVSSCQAACSSKLELVKHFGHMCGVCVVKAEIARPCQKEEGARGAPHSHGRNRPSALRDSALRGSRDRDGPQPHRHSKERTRRA